MESDFTGGHVVVHVQLSHEWLLVCMHDCTGHAFCATPSPTMTEYRWYRTCSRALELGFRNVNLVISTLEDVLPQMLVMFNKTRF